MNRLLAVRSVRALSYVALGLLGAGVILYAFAALLLMPPGGERPDLGRKIEAAAASAAGGRVLKVRELTDFAWDQVVIFPSYASDAEARKVLGFEWPAERLPTFNSDAWTTLIFATNHQVVAWCLIDRSRVDFDGTIRKRLPLVLVPDEAEFTAEVRDHGVVYLAPVGTS